MELRNLTRPSSNPLTLDLQGVTFWFTTPMMAPPFHGTPGAMLLHLYNCSNIAIRGLSIDSDPRGSIEGRVVSVDAPGNRVLLAISPGSFFAPVEVPTNASDAWFRFIPFTASGTLMAPLYPLQRIRGLSVQSLSPLNAMNQSWATFSFDTLIPLSEDPAWNASYGSFGALQPGSGIALISNFGQGVSLDKSANITLHSLSMFAVKQGLTFWGGEGGHLVSGLYSGPRPGSNQLLGGDGCNAGFGRVGVTIDNSTFVTSTDDLLNFHAAFTEVVGVASLTVLFRPDDLHAGPDGPNTYTVGAARPGDPVEFYDALSQLLGAGIVGAVLNSSAVLLVNAPPASAVGSFAFFPAGSGARWLVSNSRFMDMFQRVLVMNGPGAFANNTVVREGSGVNVGSPPAGARTAAGIPRGIQITGNTFVDAAPAPRGTLAAVFPVLLGDATDPSIVAGQDILVADNVIVRAGSNAVMVARVSDVVIRNNTFLDPLLYTARVNGTGASGVQWQAVAIVNSTNVAVDSNTLTETPPGVCKPDPVTGSRVLGLEGSNANITLDGRLV